MAKVINQDIPAQEVLYDPDPQRPYTLGEAYIQALTEGHHSPVTEGELIVQKSPRQGRPSQRGPGSTAQAPQRACFQCCAQLWRDSPQYFKDCMKEIYNETQPAPHDRQIPPEWFSTPWSSFQKLCLVKCRQEGGCSFSIFDLIDCSPPGCFGATIGYTTTSMNINETQQLTIQNPHAGASYIFQIGGGGGSVTEAGLYTAPASNVNCDQNATIDLVCETQVIDSLDIAINAGGSAFAYYADPVCIMTGVHTICQCVCFPYKMYGCDDSYLGTSQSFDCWDPWWYCWDDGPKAPYPQYCEPSVCQTKYDQRTPAQILAGCCPAGLL